MSISRFFLHSITLLLALSLPVFGQGERWQGRILDSHGHPVPYANVLIPKAQTGSYSTANGLVVLDDLSSGEHDLLVTVIGYEDLRVTIQVPQHPGVVETLVMVETVVEGATVTVTATGMPEDVLTSERTVTVLDGQRLKQASSGSMSGAIAHVAGVQIQSQGPAVAKPVIRGMSNQRVVILKDGIRQEAQQWGGHHTPEMDVLNVGRIEVLRGPVGLLYGSDAMGGVIHVQAPELKSLEEHGTPFQLGVRSGFGANSKQISGALGLQKAWESSAVRLQVSGKESGNYAVPGEETFLKEQAGTAFQDHEINLQMAHRFPNAKVELLGSSYSETQTLIGEGHWHNTGGGVDGTEPWYHVLSQVVSPTIHQTLTLKTRRFLEGGWLEMDLSAQGNHRQGGVEGETPAVDLETTTVAGELKWRRFLQNMTPATVGVSLRQTTSLSIGEERLLPDYTQNIAGVYGFRQFQKDAFTISVGGRLDGSVYDLQASDAIGLLVSEGGRTTYFPVPSGGVGLVWHEPGKPYSIAANIGTGWRPPNPYELYINGIHHGDWKIEVGDPDLKAEQSVNTDIIFRHAGTVHTGELTFFFNALSQYITSDPTGSFDESTGIPIYHIRQHDAQIWGSEMRLDHDLFSRFHYSLGWDVLFGENLELAEDVDGDGDVETALANMNPPRVLFGLGWSQDDQGKLKEVTANLDGEWVFAQTHLAEFENVISDGYGGVKLLEPAGYFLLNAHLGFETHLLGSDWSVGLGAQNVLNTPYYSHLSKYKGLAYDPGFNLVGDVSLRF